MTFFSWDTSYGTHITHRMSHILQGDIYWCFVFVCFTILQSDSNPIVLRLGTLALCVWGGGLFLMVLFQPSLRFILNTIRLQMTSGLSDDKHSWNEAKDEIIHVCVWLPSENDSNIKCQLIQERTNKRPILEWEPIK